MNKSRRQEFENLRKDLSNIDTNRGGSESALAGFLAEPINATESNLKREKAGIAARERVLDNNGLADAVIQYTNGQSGREIQDKYGYNFSIFKRMIISGKYDGMILRINPDNPIFKNPKHQEILKELTKEHCIKLEKGAITKTEAKALAKVFRAEGKIWGAIVGENKAPVSATMYVANKEITDFIEPAKEKVIGVTIDKFTEKTNEIKHQTKDAIKKTNTFIDDATERFTSKNFAEINRSGLDEAASSAMFAATLSITKNAVLVCKGEEDVNEALKQVLVDTSTSYALGYVAGTIEKAMGIETSPAYLLANATVQNTKHMVAYVNGQIDEKQLIENVAESSAYLIAAYVGKIVGAKLIPIPYVGAYIGEMITTAICTQVISEIKTTKAFKKENERIISLYKKAEREIKASQERLKKVVQQENQELISTIQSGFDEIEAGIQADSYAMIQKGFVTIGGKFGFTEEDFSTVFVTRKSLFSKETIVFE